ncbi:beta-ketoacyl synthase N-terminal-like domain-containing protein, partial [Streptomyces griseus]
MPEASTAVAPTLGATPGTSASGTSALRASAPEAPAPETSTATPPPVPHEHDAPVAVIGVACRLPGADGPDAFWELLRTGRDAVRELPAGRRTEGAPAVAGYLDRIDTFDAEFFGIS